MVPQISAVFRQRGGGHLFSCVDGLHLHGGPDVARTHHTGPEVIRTISGEDISMEDAAGARVHGEDGHCRRYVAADEVDCLLAVRRLISFLPANNVEGPRQVEVQDVPYRPMVKGR